MSVTVSYPRYSFMQPFGSESCYHDPGVCLPISSNKNLAFEMILDCDEGAGVLFALYDNLFVTPVPADFDCTIHSVPAINTFARMINVTNINTSFHDTDTFTSHCFMDSPSLDFDESDDWRLNIYYPAIGECFKFCIFTRVIAESADRVLGCTRCFIRTAKDDCQYSQLSYWNNDDMFDFRYRKTPDLTFHNKVELPFFLRDPGMTNDAKVYTKSDGSVVKLYERKEEQYTLETDMMPYTWLKALDIALSHDFIQITNPSAAAFDPVNTAQFFHKKDTFEIEYPKGSFTAMGKGTSKLINAKPVHLYNNNCG